MKDHLSFLVAFVLSAVCLALMGASFFLAKPAKVALAEGGAAAPTTTAYTDAALGYSLTYPAGFSVNPIYSYNPPGPAGALSGVSFGISPALAESTHLSSDSFVSIESVPSGTDCSLKSFFGDEMPTSTDTISDNGTAYRFAVIKNPRTKQFYEEYVYLRKSSCLAVRYFIHAASSADADVTAAVASFDTVRHSLSVNP